MNQATFTTKFNETLTVKVGDTVEFKADMEQIGTVTKIARRQYGGFDLFLENEDGFCGYLSGKKTVIHSDDVIEIL